MKNYRVRKGSLADKAIRFRRFIDRHDKASFTVAMIIFWGSVYAAIVNTYPL